MVGAKSENCAEKANSNTVVGVGVEKSRHFCSTLRREKGEKLHFAKQIAMLYQSARVASWVGGTSKERRYTIYGLKEGLYI